MIRKLLAISTLGVALLAASQADAYGILKKKKGPPPRRGVGVPELSVGHSATSALALLAGGALVAAGRRRRKV